MYNRILEGIMYRGNVLLNAWEDGIIVYRGEKYNKILARSEVWHEEDYYITEYKRRILYELYDVEEEYIAKCWHEKCYKT